MTVLSHACVRNLYVSCSRAVLGRQCWRLSMLGKQHMSSKQQQPVSALHVCEKVYRRCISFWLAGVACVAGTHATPTPKCGRQVCSGMHSSQLEFFGSGFGVFTEVRGQAYRLVHQGGWLLQCNTCPQATQHSSLCIMAGLSHAWQQHSSLVWCSLATVPQSASHCVDRWQCCRVSGRTPLHGGEHLL